MAVYTFSDRSHLVLQVARDEAAALGHDYIGPEHILLALLRDTDSAAVGLLTRLGTDIPAIRATLEGILKPGRSTAPDGVLSPYTSRAKIALERAMMAMADDNQHVVGTQHLLLGLLREAQGIAAQALVQSGVTVAAVTAALGGVEVE